MSKIGQHYVELTEMGRLERDEYAPEAQLPPDYQKSIDRDFKDNWASLDKDMASKNPPYGDK